MPISPARVRQFTTVAILIGNEDALRAHPPLRGRVGHCRRCSTGGAGFSQRHDPDVWSFLVGGEVDVDGAEQHPLAVGRGHGFAHTLERHHVFEGEWMLGLGKSEDNVKKCKEQGEHTAHTYLRGQTR